MASSTGIPLEPRRTVCVCSHHQFMARPYNSHSSTIPDDAFQVESLDFSACPRCPSQELQARLTIISSVTPWSGSFEWVAGKVLVRIYRHAR